jgi:hypothetical protein
MFFLTVAGGIDVFRYAIAPISGWKEFSAEEVKLAKRISVETPPDAIFLNAPIFNHPVFLSGRRSLMGYSAHIWSHGYNDAHRREQDVQTMLKGKSDAITLINTYKPFYVTIGPHEKRIGVNKKFFDTNYPCIITTENYRIYDLTNRKDRQPFTPMVSNKQNLNDQRYGLSVCNYDNMNWEGEPVSEEVVENIEFNWSDDEIKPIPSPFSAIWKGYIEINTAGKYTFKLTSDDGSWLYIDDVLVIDNGGSHAIKSVAGMVALEAGKHKILIKYFDAGGGAVINMTWVPPSGVEGKIPVTNLSR